MRIVYLWIALLLSTSVYAQVPRQVVVEHFTNTLCGICASRNPGFYQNLIDHPQVLHMAVHPSRPYSSCLLHQHNPTENDDRAKHYEGVFIATPRIVVQGVPVSPGQNYGSPDVFAPYLDQQSDVALSVQELRYGADSVAVEVTVEHVSNANLTEARLFIAYNEDTVFYAGPNGEDEHYGVFRERLTEAEGDVISIPAVGNTVVVRRSVIPRADWDTSRMVALAILTPTDDVTVLQAAETSVVSEGTVTTNVSSVGQVAFSISPNPSQGRVTLHHPQHDVVILDLQGRSLQSIAQPYDGQQVDLDMLPVGLYILRHGQDSYRLRKE